MFNKLLTYFEEDYVTTINTFIYWHLQTILMSDYFKVLLYKRLMDNERSKFLLHILQCRIGTNYNYLIFTCVMNYKPYCLFNEQQKQKLSQMEIISKSLEEKDPFRLNNIWYCTNNNFEKISKYKTLYSKLNDILEKEYKYEIETDMQKIMLYLT